MPADLILCVAAIFFLSEGGTTISVHVYDANGNVFKGAVVQASLDYEFDDEEKELSPSKSRADEQGRVEFHPPSYARVIFVRAFDSEEKTYSPNKAIALVQGKWTKNPLKIKLRSKVK